MGIDAKLRTFLGLVLCTFLLSARANETNFWPAYVKQADSVVGRTDQIGSLGPVFSLKEAAATRILSIRPFWTSFHDRETGNSSSHILYPLLNWVDRGDVQSGHAYNIIQYRRNEPRDETFFQVFPFLFSNQSPERDASYFALWPLGGVLKNRLWRDRITFAAWPLYVRTHRNDEVRTHVPYPFVQILKGPKSEGFGLWPLYGHFERENDYDHTWALWPLHYHYFDQLDEAVPYERFGVLPFYHRETAAGLKSETFAWPFFGYTREVEPRKTYSENRYFWPLLVQGRGEEKFVNRWLPLYSRETKPGYEKEWYLWPLLQKKTFNEPGFLRERTTFLYFLYRDERQTFADTQARLTTLWPLVSYWNDGAGQKQVQVLDPLTVFFPSNQKVKENWNPLFAVYRYDERTGNGRHSLFWDFIVWEKDDDGLNAFYAGPLFEWVNGSHWEVLKGLVGSKKEKSDRRVRYFWRR